MRSLKYPSPILQMHGFSNRLIWDDVLHVAWRGFAADFVASVLVDMFGKGGALLRAHDLAKHWAKWRGLELALDEFSLSEDAYPSLNAKGNDIKMLCLWLVPWQN